jgi:hypothetical protein
VGQVAPVARPVETPRSSDSLLAENVALRSQLAANESAAGRRAGRRRR